MAQCKHDNFDEYFEVCTDCGVALEEMPEEIQAIYKKMIESEE